MTEFFLNMTNSSGPNNGARAAKYLDINNTRSQKLQTFDEKKIYPVQSYSQLIGASPARRKIIEEIESCVELPTQYYKAIYGELIEKFVVFVQLLPVNNDARLASILDEGLLRGLYALHLMTPQKIDAFNRSESSAFAAGAPSTKVHEVDPLQCYALFSAALLFDVGCVIENRAVVLSGKSGNFISSWDPFREGAMANGGYYRVRRGGGITPASCRRSALALANSLMPTLGFEWLYSDSETFNTWLALVAGEREAPGTMQLQFDRLHEMLEDFKATDKFFELMGGVTELEPSKELKCGDDFIDWLRQALTNNIIPADVADGLIFHTSPNELLFSPDLFKRYLANRKGGKPDWRTVLNSLINLGMFTDDQLTAYRLRSSPDAMKGRGVGGGKLFAAGVGLGVGAQAKVAPGSGAADSNIETITENVLENKVGRKSGGEGANNAIAALQQNNLPTSLAEQFAAGVPIEGFEATDLLMRLLKSYLPLPDEEFIAQLFPETPQEKFRGLKILFKLIKFLLGMGFDFTVLNDLTGDTPQERRERGNKFRNALAPTAQSALKKRF
jgi:hypothetical protein